MRRRRQVQVAVSSVNKPNVLVPTIPSFKHLIAPTSCHPLTKKTMRRIQLWTIVFVLVRSCHAQNDMSAPTPEPMISGACMALEPQKDCGLHEWSMPCSKLLSSFEWDSSSTCCSFSDTHTGCLLTVGGPGSSCSWKELDRKSYYNVYISDDTTSSCPAS